MYLLSTVVMPVFAAAQIVTVPVAITRDMLEQVTRNLNGHPTTNAVLRAACPTLPEPEKAFWDGDGIALAVRPRGGVRGGESVQVTVEDLEAVVVWFARSPAGILHAVETLAPYVTGLRDLHALEKMRAEQQELIDAAPGGDAATEAADVAWYAGKAVHNGLIRPDLAERAIVAAEQGAGIPAGAALTALRAKYITRIALRAKNKDLERAVVMAALEAK